MSEPVYSRARDVVWRLGPDRVLVRRIGSQGVGVAAELIGGAAFAWIALDEPATLPELAVRLQPSMIRLPATSELDELVGLGWLRNDRKAQST